MRAECGLSKKQAALYERAVEDLAKRLEDADGMARRGLVLATLMQLKQICNHPAQYLDEPNSSADDSGKFERLAADLRADRRAAGEGAGLHAVSVADASRWPSSWPGSSVGRVWSCTAERPSASRTELVREFQDDRGPPFFVISLKAGGSGLNLTAASHVIHFDRWWNPAVENQATDRAFRIGQKRNVLVHKFVCRGTVEERIDDMLRDKQQLADQLLGDPGETALTELSDDELLRVVSLDLHRALADE